MKYAQFTVRLIKANPHRERSNAWRAGQIVTGMEGCHVGNIIRALTVFEEDTSDVGVGDPARWLTHFAGLESQASGKKIDPWIEIVNGNDVICDVNTYRSLLRRKG